MTYVELLSINTLESGIFEVFKDYPFAIWLYFPAR
jgi:hypothetical protein